MSLNSFLNRKFKKPSFDEISENIKGKLRKVSLPNVESGALRLVEKVFNLNSNSIVNNSNLTVSDVKDADFEQIERYVSAKKFSHDHSKDVYSYVVDSISNRFVQNGYVIKQHCSARESLDILPKDTSSCYPLYLKKSDKKSVEHCFKNIKKYVSYKYVDQKFEQLKRFPTSIFHRFTPKIKKAGKYYLNKYKIRQIFGVPQFICMLEVMFLGDFKDAFFSEFKNIFTGGLTKDEVNSKIEEIRNNCLLTDSYILCGDISACDKSVSDTFHYSFSKIVDDLITENEIRKLVYPILKYNTYTPIISLRNKYEFSIGSTTTGSWLTTIFTTIVVYISLNYSYFKLYGSLIPDCNILIQGDDFLLIINDPKDAESIKRFMSELGLNLKIEATTSVRSDETIEFLGYFWEYNKGPNQTDEWIMARILFPEKRILFDGPGRVISRYLSLIFQLNRWKDLFYRFLTHDVFLKEEILGKETPSFEIINNNGEITYNNFPIKHALEVGWRMF